MQAATAPSPALQRGRASAPAAVACALAENTALIASILHHHNSGRHAAAATLLTRLQANLAYVATVADALAPAEAACSAAPLQAPAHAAAPAQAQSLPAPAAWSRHYGAATGAPTLAPLASPGPATPMGGLGAQLLQPPTRTVPVAVQIPVAAVPPVVPGAGGGTMSASASASVSASASAVCTGDGGASSSAAIAAPIKFWTPAEHELFEDGLRLYWESGKEGRPNLKAIADHVGTRTPIQVRSHLQKYVKKLQKTGAKMPSGPLVAGTPGSACVANPAIASASGVVTFDTGDTGAATDVAKASPAVLASSSTAALVQHDQQAQQSQALRPNGQQDQPTQPMLGTHGTQGEEVTVHDQQQAQ
jgi:SHAQKYF class myb-like DNA-binding protein